MGLIKKKTAIRGTEGGIKYVCDVCSSDITATVSLRRASSRQISQLTTFSGANSMRRLL
jgi:hypothetical protein